MKKLLMTTAAALGLLLWPHLAPAQDQKTPVYVDLTTSKGDIVLELNPAAAPQTVANFVGYVEAGHYNGTIFHRVIGNFMIQGGGLDKALKEKSAKAPIKNEANNGLKNEKYALAMARTGDPHSATAQFFINTKDNEFLNFKAENAQGWGYAVFGKVVKGQAVVDEIAKSKTGKVSAYDDVPVIPVTIDKAVVLKDYKK
ncbi:MAG: peptidyl-prolyl cis-trans isomerase [Candidatus Adiutrix sp.]|jgi:peptidyl-prolyl cis-trans isomerase B (cyclophilin B)|nr:peptidyl-prolyl cis-trans isomerase [Candidatus Adiutrix sp.]